MLCCCLPPDTPAAIISIPTINKDNPIIIPARIAPNNGDANTNADIITFNTPTPIRNPLIQPLLVLFVTPSIILANPSNIRAKPRKYITTIAAAIGNDNANPAKMIVSIPSPMVAKRDLCAINIPVIIFSIPTTNKTTETRITTVRNVRPGNAIARPDNIMANAPKPI